jgi:hypothetical protein
VDTRTIIPFSYNWRIVDVLVDTGGIPSWTTFLREEEYSKKSKEDH